jgi:hypothetical protein
LQAGVAAAQIIEAVALIVQPAPMKYSLKREGMEGF